MLRQAQHERKILNHFSHSPLVLSPSKDSESVFQQPARGPNHRRSIRTSQWKLNGAMIRALRSSILCAHLDDEFAWAICLRELRNGRASTNNRESRARLTSREL